MKIVEDMREADADITHINVFGVEIETTNKVASEFDSWRESVELEYAGAIGGEFTLKITPTSIGTIYEMEHANGSKFALTDWRLFG